jgi:uncharacterized NAD(P)/FAD-binding protein YdhS
MHALSTVISVRVPKWVKEKLEAHGVNIAELVRRRLMEEVEKLEEEELRRQLNELRDLLREKIDLYELAAIVDEERRR